MRKSVMSEVVKGIEKETSVSYEHNALSKIVLAMGESGDDDGWQRRPWIFGRTSLLAQRNNTQHIGKSNDGGSSSQRQGQFRDGHSGRGQHLHSPIFDYGIKMS